MSSSDGRKGWAGSLRLMGLKETAMEGPAVGRMVRTTLVAIDAFLATSGGLALIAWMEGGHGRSSRTLLGTRWPLKPGPPVTSFFRAPSGRLFGYCSLPLHPLERVERPLHHRKRRFASQLFPPRCGRPSLRRAVEGNGTGWARVGSRWQGRRGREHYILGMLGIEVCGSWELGRR